MDLLRYGARKAFSNEFGLTSVDHDLVRAGREQPVVTSAGCLCCVAGSDLRGSLDELLTLRRKGEAPPSSRVIVETTGLADPAPIVNSLIPGGARAMALRDHAVARAFRLSSVLRLPAWPDTRLLVIGETLDEAALRRSFATAIG